MNSIQYRIIKGHPYDVLPTLKRRVGRYTRNVGEFKIGRTSTPKARANQADYASAYDEMIVIYETAIVSHVNEVERELVGYFSAHDDNRNFRGGGGGPLGRAPHYIYVVRSKTFLDNLFSLFK